jgi:hypothetical protein
MSRPIPLVYRLLFTTLEPIAALFGAFLLLRNPAQFLATMSPSAALSASKKVIYDQLAATYTLMAWNQAVVLRLAGASRDDPRTMRVWRGVMFGVLVCDAMHLYGSFEALGGDVFWSPARWRGEDWGNLAFLWAMAAVRLAFLFGLGLRGRHEAEVEKKK